MLSFPFLAWFLSGALKFMFNSIRYGSEAKKNHIGNGGFPSTHTSVISSITMLIGFTQGFDTALFGLGAAFTFIVIIDATGVRRAVGESAKHINSLNRRMESGEAVILREKKQGHTRAEVLGGLAVGTLIAWVGSLFITLF